MTRPRQARLSMLPALGSPPPDPRGVPVTVPGWPPGVQQAVVDQLAALVLADLELHPFGSLPTDTATGAPSTGHHRTAADAQGDAPLAPIAGPPRLGPVTGRRRGRPRARRRPGGVVDLRPSRPGGPHAGHPGGPLPVVDASGHAG
jgi:hypothetical protein